MEDHNFFRIEVYYPNGNLVQNGAGGVFGWIMSLNNLEPTPHLWGSYKKIEHWFTKKGWEKVGTKIVEEHRRNFERDYKLKIRKRKTKPAKVHFADEYQIMVAERLQD